MSEKREVGLCRITAVLSYNGILQFLSNGLTAIAIPTQLSIFAPKKTALFSGIMLGIGSFIAATSPIVGHVSDRIGRRPVLVSGAFLVSAGEVLLILGVYSDKANAALGFTLFFAGYLVIQVGNVLMMTCFNALVADVSSQMPHMAGRVSSIYGLYGLTGATISYAAAGALFPVTASDHTFYWLCAALTILSNIALLASVPPSSRPDPDAHRPASGLARAMEVTRMWCSSDAYLPWRRVVISRGLYFFCGGTFGTTILFFMYDCTDSRDPQGQFTLIALCSLAGSFAAAWPAGKIADSWGSYVCVVASSLLMGVVFAIIPLTSQVTMFYLIIPFYGMAQQVYQVADLSMVTAVLPDPEKRARDMGGWACFESIGNAIGAVLGGALLTLVGKSDETVAESRDDDKLFADVDDDAVGSRIRYTREGYMAVYFPAAGALVVAALMLFPIRHRLRNKTASEAVASPETASFTGCLPLEEFAQEAGSSHQVPDQYLEGSNKSPLLEQNGDFY